MFYKKKKIIKCQGSWWGKRCPEEVPQESRVPLCTGHLEASRRVQKENIGRLAFLKSKQKFGRAYKELAHV